MPDYAPTQFSHVKAGDTAFVRGGLRDFFVYRDLGVAEATNGKVIAHLVRANMAPETGTGWHRHAADFQIVIMTYDLPLGKLTYKGRIVNPGAIRRTALMTVEGERDDICAVGQTVAAQDLCTGIRPYMETHHVQTGVGHHGVFSGRKWNQQIYPRVREMIHASLG